MEYQGYKDRTEVLSLVEKYFPYIDRPSDDELMFFGDDDLVCRFLKDHMRSYQEPALPIDGVRYLHSELVNLSPKGIAWLLPSLLREAVYSNKHDTLSEFLVYDLAYSDERFENIKTRYSLLTKEQLMCLGIVLEFISEEHGHLVASSMETLDALRA